MSAEWIADRDSCAAYERDVSGLRRAPDWVARPGSRGEAVACIREAAARGVAVTPAGAQTSTTGASVAMGGGLLLSFRAMDRILAVDAEARTARVEPGVLLGDLNRAVRSHGLFFAPDPTSEDESTVGGAIACNASGPRTLRYGPTRHHVRALSVVLADGSVMESRRPIVEKNTAGYLLAQDPVDWFVGSEGTLGAVVEAELALLPLPAVTLGLAVPFPDEPSALAFIVAARESNAVHPRCLEYFDREAFAVARTHRRTPSWAPNAGAMVYLEEAGDSEPDADAWLSLAERLGATGVDIEAFDGEQALPEARGLRHAVPSAMHERAAPFLPRGGRRVSTDWAVPYFRVTEAIALARRIADAHGVPPAVTYGHLGNGHPHQNFIATDPDSVHRHEAAVEETLRAIIAMGGTVAAEHGIGKLKARWLSLQMNAHQVQVMRAVKQALDPDGRMAPGNIL